ncbi:hypothetical protein ACVBEQ_04535 [Nakamurella sp. GG22]
MTAASVTPSGTSGLDATIVMGWCGPEQHGITRFARQIASAAISLGFAGAVMHEAQPHRLIGLVDRLPGETRLLHLQLNDWLFADAGLDADAFIDQLADRLRSRRVALAVTVHDLPQASDGPTLYQRRCGTYRHLIASAVGVVVSSEHESLLLQEALGDTAAAATPEPRPHGTPLTVIPLPIDPLAPFRPTGTASTHLSDGTLRPEPGDPGPTIGIFGYVYPGKGHREVVEEVMGIDPAPVVVAVGRAAARHAELLDELTCFAGRRGILFRCTGYVPDSDLQDMLREVTVPVAPHTHISASGSINSWLAAGRRPLVPAGRYVDELERRMPGALWIYQPGELRPNVERAIADPELTWLSKDVQVGPTTLVVAQRYLEWLRQRAAEVAEG